jgi:phosphatidylglycerophosphatase A
MTLLSLAKFVSTVGFIGYLPFAHGTFGTLIGLIFMVILKPDLSLHITLSILFIIIGIISSNQTIKLLKNDSYISTEKSTYPPFSKGGAGGIKRKGKLEVKKKDDPNFIVIDEFGGYMVSLLFLPLTWDNLIAAFILFRIFDIIKPPPIKTIEIRLKGGLGIMADDVMAGVYTNILLQLWRLFSS